MASILWRRLDALGCQVSLLRTPNRLLISLPIRPILINRPLLHPRHSTPDHGPKDIPPSRCCRYRLGISRSAAQPRIASIANGSFAELASRAVGTGAARGKTAAIVDAVCAGGVGVCVAEAGVLAAAVFEGAAVCLCWVAAGGGDDFRGIVSGWGVIDRDG